MKTLASPSREDVLGAFAVEAIHDKATLERYLRDYPQHAVPLACLSHEISRAVPTQRGTLSAQDEAWIDKAWHDYLAQTEKAWRVTNMGGGEENAVIVFAANRSAARRLAQGGEGFDCDWVDLHAVRHEVADRYGRGRTDRVVRWQGAALRIYWELGWRLFEAEECPVCGRFEHESIPESELGPDGEGEDACRQCRAAEKPVQASVVGARSDGSRVRSPHPSHQGGGL